MYTTLRFGNVEKHTVVASWTKAHIHLNVESRDQTRNFEGSLVLFARDINANWIFWNWRFGFGFVADGCLDARPASASPGAGDQ